MKYYIISGEASGDIHASRIIGELKKHDPSGEFRCWGGEAMQEAGGNVIKHYRDLAFMGFWEVLINLKTVLNNVAFCKKDIVAWKPDAVILVDYPGFNMRIARFVKKLGIKVYYYIAPQVWAWKKNRVHKIHRNTDLVFVVMPFEVDFYKKFGYNVAYTGHPMPDSIDLKKKIEEKDFQIKNELNYKPIIALMPGSRRQEINRILPYMLSITSYFPEYQFVTAALATRNKSCICPKTTFTGFSCMYLV